MTAFERHQEAIRTRLRESGLTRPGPGSVSWTINREVIVLAGWGRAILMQLAHPLVGAGVGDHSNFRGGLGNSIKRLKSTVGAMLSITFGDDEAAIAAAARVNVIHDRVNGNTGGERYSAHDADLLLWVHATLLESIPRVFELLVRPLTREERDRYCVEAAVMEPLLDIPPGTLPRSSAALESYLDTMLSGGRIAVNDRSRALAHAALYPPRWQLLWPLLRPAQLITIGLLPPALRQAYGFSWTAREERALRRWTTTLRFGLRLTPAFLRQWPSSRCRAAADGHLTRISPAPHPPLKT